MSLFRATRNREMAMFNRPPLWELPIMPSHPDEIGLHPADNKPNDIGGVAHRF